MAYFKVNTRIELAKLLLVAPPEIDEVIQNRGRYYRSIRLRKPDGGTRTLRVPDGNLKAIQDKVKRCVLDTVPLLDCVHGGVGGRSPHTNARPHIGNKVVFISDVKDFFPSVGPRAVSTIFRVLGFAAEALATLVDLTTWDDQLPQGAPTSLGVANLAMHKVDVRLSSLAAKHRFVYTRYVDDLAISGGWRLLHFRRLIQRIVEDEGFAVNPAKIKTMPLGTRQVITGIVVNEKLNLPRETIDSIRRQVSAATASGVRTPMGIDRVRGQLAWLASINTAKALRLRSRLTRAGIR